MKFSLAPARSLPFVVGKFCPGDTAVEVLPRQLEYYWVKPQADLCDIADGTAGFSATQHYNQLRTMSINQSISITSSVGFLGANNRSDVCIVQSRLNELMGPSRRELIVDGAYGPKTGLAITQFQRYACGFKWPDGLVDPGKTTVRKLNDPESARKWSLACSVSDSQIDRFMHWWQMEAEESHQIASAPQQSKDLLKLKQEYRLLDETIKGKYPKGRPDGLGVLALYTPASGTKRNLDWLANTINKASRERGQGWGCVTALVSTATVPFLVVYGLAEDSFRTIYELTFEPEVHGDSSEYDKLVGELRRLKRRIEAFD